MKSKIAWIVLGVIALFAIFSFVAEAQFTGGGGNTGGGFTGPGFWIFTDDGNGVLPANSLNIGSFDNQVPNLYVDNLFGSTTQVTSIGGDLDFGGYNIENVGLTTGTHFIATSTTATSTFAGGFTVDSTDFVVDPDGGLVGIGTASPASKLDIRGLLTLGESNGAGLTHFLNVMSGSASNRVNGMGLGTNNDELIIFTDENNQGAGTESIQFKVGGSERVRIDDSGRVGIGASPSEATLEVAGTSGEFLKIGTQTNDWEGNMALGATNGNGFIIGKNNTSNNTNRVMTFIRDDTDGGTITGYEADGTTVSFQIRGENTSYFNGGNVGIRTASPISDLDVSSSTAPQLTLSRSDTTIGIGDELGVIAFRGQDGDVAEANRVIAKIVGVSETAWTGTATGGLAFHTGQPPGTSVTERMRIDASGNVGIGTTTPDTLLNIKSASSAYTAINTGGTLHVEDTATNGNLMIGVNGTGGGVLQGRDGLTGTFPVSLNPFGGNVGIGLISPDSNLHIAAVAPSLQIDATEAATGTASIILDADRSSSGELAGQIQFSNNNQATPGGAIKVFRGSVDSLGEMTLSTSGSERLRIDSDGNVGIGTSTPESIFHVDSGASATTTVDFGDQVSGTAHTCFNVAQADGSAASFYFMGGAMVVETNACN